MRLSAWPICILKCRHCCLAVFYKPACNRIQETCWPINTASSVKEGIFCVGRFNISASGLAHWGSEVTVIPSDGLICQTEDVFKKNVRRKNNQTQQTRSHCESDFSIVFNTRICFRGAAGGLQSYGILVTVVKYLEFEGGAEGDNLMDGGKGAREDAKICLQI